MTQTDNVLLFHEANSLEMLRLHYKNESYGYALPSYRPTWLC